LNHNHLVIDLSKPLSVVALSPPSHPPLIPLSSPSHPPVILREVAGSTLAMTAAFEGCLASRWPRLRCATGRAGARLSGSPWRRGGVSLGPCALIGPRGAGGPRPGLPRASGRQGRRTECEPAIQAPAHPAARSPRWVKKTTRFLVVALASTGHRGRVDARGRPPGRSPGLTRTTDRGARAPSREGHCRGAWRRAWVRDAKRRAIVRQDKERRRADRSFASSPPPCQCAGRGHRRGLDGPSMPKPLLKQPCLLSTHPGAGAAGWAGARIAGSHSVRRP